MNKPGHVMTVAVHLDRITNPTPIRERYDPDAKLTRVGNAAEQALCITIKNWGRSTAIGTKGKTSGK
jgi:hypothetical protein